MEPDLAENNALHEYLAGKIERPLGHDHYLLVKAILIYWEDSDNLEAYRTEADNLKSFFQDLNYETEIYRIPLKNSQLRLHQFITSSLLDLSDRVSDVSAPCLLIIHYGGHGDKDDDKHHPDGAQEKRAVWRAYYNSEENSVVKWYQIQQSFHDVAFDVLLLLDCCYAAQAGRGSAELPPGRIELLAASGDTEKGTPGPGDKSFTTAMIKQMKRILAEKRCIQISELHTALVHRKADLWTIPFHVKLRAGPSERSIKLERLHGLEDETTSLSSWKAEVGLRIRTRVPLTTARMDEIAQWLHREAPKSIIASLQVENVLQTTARLHEFIKDTLPRKDHPVARALDRPVFDQIEDGWATLQMLVEQLPSHLNDTSISNDGEWRIKLVTGCLEQIHAENSQLLGILRKGIIMSHACSDPDSIEEIFADPVSDLLEMKDELNLRRIICSSSKDSMVCDNFTSEVHLPMSGFKLVEEYKLYEPYQPDSVIRQMEARVKLLALLLRNHKPDIFRCLPLHSWEHQEVQNQFVYRFRIPDSYQEEHGTLYDVIRSTKGAKRPSLGERFAMAVAVAKAVEQWHRVDWVHQGITAHNVLLFKPRSITPARYDFISPFLQGFDFSRPNTQPSLGHYVENVEVNIYRHPQRQGISRDGHKKIHDLYSLGVVLLEIGLWRTALSIVQDATKLKHIEDLTRKTMVDCLVDAAQDRLAHYAGTDYQDAVLSCLRGDFGVEKDDERDTELLDAVGNKVLDKLSACAKLR